MSTANSQQTDAVAGAQNGSAQPVTAGPIPLSDAILEAVRTWAADDRLWGSRSTTEFNLCTFARLVLKDYRAALAAEVASREQAVADLEELRSNIRRSAGDVAAKELVDEIAAPFVARATEAEAKLEQAERERDDARRMTEERSNAFAMFPPTLARAKAAEARLTALQAALEGLEQEMRRPYMFLWISEAKMHAWADRLAALRTKGAPDAKS